MSTTEEVLTTTVLVSIVSYAATHVSLMSEEALPIDGEFQGYARTHVEQL